MNVYTKNEITEILGKRSMWDTKGLLKPMLEYIDGVNTIDEIFENRKGLIKGGPKNIILEVLPKGLRIGIVAQFKPLSIAILNENIIKMTMESPAHIQEHKEKSVVGRALVGGLLLGPLGAVIGGISGTTNSGIKSTGVDMILTINIIHEGIDINIFVQVPHKNNKVVFDFLKANYSDRVDLIK